MRELSWFYLYRGGGLIYVLGSVVCIRSGVLDLKEPSERAIFVATTICLILFATGHGLFQFVLPFVE